jgi:hypothetical protein
MKKIPLILVILLGLSTLVFAQPKDNFIVIKREGIEGIIVPEERGKDFFSEACQAQGYWTPRQEDVLEIEEELPVYLKEQAPKESADLWKRLSDYKRQYVGIIVDGKKKIWINFFHNAFVEESRINWQKEPVLVSDGGDHFFNIIYDLKERTFSDLLINGEA